MSLYIDETGTPGAPSIVFLHGVRASGWMWAKQIAALSDFHCLNVDLPGHGKSNQEPWHSLRDTARQIAGIIEDQATHGRAHIVGLSLGGYLALFLLERHADVLDRVIMSGVTAAPMPNRALLRPQLWLTSLLIKRRRVMNSLAKSMHIPPEMHSAFVENLLAVSHQACRRIYEEAAEYRVPLSLRSVDIPTLITAGSQESDIITQAVSSIAELMPNAQGWLAPGFGHGWNVEAPDLFTAMIRSWITGTALPARLQMAHGGSRASG